MGDGRAWSIVDHIRFIYLSKCPFLTYWKLFCSLLRNPAMRWLCAAVVLVSIVSRMREAKEEGSEDIHSHLVANGKVMMP